MPSETEITRETFAGFCPRCGERSIRVCATFLGKHAKVISDVNIGIRCHCPLDESQIIRAGVEAETDVNDPDYVRDPRYDQPGDFK